MSEPARAGSNDNSFDLNLPVFNAPEPEPPVLSMDEYARWIDEGPLYEWYPQAREEALKREPPTVPFVLDN